MNALFRLVILVPFLAGPSVLANDVDVLSIVQSNFQAADVNGDGALDDAEFPALIDANAESKIGRAATVRRFGAYDRAFRTADRNGDGAVTWDEIEANRPD